MEARRRPMMAAKAEVAVLTCDRERREKREREEREEEKVACRFKLGSITPTGLARLNQAVCSSVTSGHTA
jgi:hypothetical protein